MMVLLVEDHRLLAETLGDFLAAHDVKVDFAHTGQLALNLAAHTPYDAVILDINLPGMDGFEVAQNLRKTLLLDLPILMLTARDTLEDKLEGFQSGTDDYLVKPFEQKELLARLQALVARHRGQMVQKAKQYGPLKLDYATKQVQRDGQPLTVSPIGFAILDVLCRHAPNPVSRQTLEHEIWEDEPPDTDSLRSHLYNLRKVVDQPFEQALIKTLKNVGYKLEI